MQPVFLIIKKVIETLKKKKKKQLQQLAEVKGKQKDKHMYDMSYVY
jgi:hypothetical protein